MKKVVFIFLLLLAFFGVSTFLFLQHSSRPVSQYSTSRSFTINQGDGIISVGTRLKNLKLIRNQFSFLYNAYVLGLNKKIQSGTFFLSPSMSTSEIIVRLSQGGSRDYWLIIKEGYRSEEISFLFPENVPFSKSEFVQAAIKQEGYLFPDSYLIPYDYNLEHVFSIIKENFTKKVSDKLLNTQSTLSQNQKVILASLLEREGKTLESKKVIAGIIYNRLSLGMPLQIDATVQYTRDSKIKTLDYWKPLQKNDLNIDSPYNTYKVGGLPPSPICNPGLDSLISAVNPANSDYLYYISGSDGQMYYARTLDEHNQNIAKYLK